MKRLMFFLAIVTICCFTSSADAQVRATDAQQSKDSIEEAVSIADLEMIVPENRLKPEPQTDDASSELVESPYSATYPRDPAASEAAFTASDLEMLESMSPTEQAEEAPSR